MVLKQILLITATLGVCASVVQGQTTTAAPPIVSTWGACAGIYCGTDPCGVCVAGTVCVKLNDFFSQCQPSGNVPSGPSAMPQPTPVGI